MVASLVLGLSFIAAATARAVNQPLRFTQEGTFQLSVFSDLHYGEGKSIPYLLLCITADKNLTASGGSRLGSAAGCQLNACDKFHPLGGTAAVGRAER